MSAHSLEALAQHLIRNAFHGGCAPLDPALLPAYATHGLAVTAPEGNCWFGKTMACAPHGGVQYCMDAHGEPAEIAHGIAARAMVIERHHDLVKQVVAYCEQRGLGPVWALCSGVNQAQVFLGNRSGYLAILYLSMHDAADETTPDEEPDDFDATGRRLYTFDVQWAENNRHFDHRFAIPGIRVRLSDTRESD